VTYHCRCRDVTTFYIYGRFYFTLRFFPLLICTVADSALFPFAFTAFTVDLCVCCSHYVLPLLLLFFVHWWVAAATVCRLPYVHARYRCYLFLHLIVLPLLGDVHRPWNNTAGGITYILRIPGGITILFYSPLFVDSLYRYTCGFTTLPSPTTVCTHRYAFRLPHCVYLTTCVGGRLRCRHYPDVERQTVTHYVYITITAHPHFTHAVRALPTAFTLTTLHTVWVLRYVAGCRLEFR